MIKIVYIDIIVRHAIVLITRLQGYHVKLIIRILFKQFSLWDCISSNVVLKKSKIIIVKHIAIDIAGTH